MSRQIRTRIVLNVYDLSEINAFTSSLGFGAYHSGVEIGGSDEFTFASGAGIFYTNPKEVEGAVFRESIEIGFFEGSCRDAKYIIDSMRPEFPGDSYHIITRNCNYFANELCMKLVNKPIPAFVNRIAYFGSFISCLIPSQFTNPESEDQSQSNSRLLGNSPTTNNALSFSGKGMATGNSNGSTPTSSDSTLIDRREKMREAALRRMQQNENKD